MVVRSLLGLLLVSVALQVGAYPGFFLDPNSLVYGDRPGEIDRLPPAVQQHWNSNFMLHTHQVQGKYRVQGIGSSFKIRTIGNKVYLGTALHNIRGQGGNVCPVQGYCTGVSIKHNFGTDQAGQIRPVGADSYSAGNVKVVKIDPANDLALLEITSSELANDQKYPPIPIAETCPQVGDKQYAICHPPAWNSGNRHTPTTGAVRVQKYWSGGRLTSDGVEDQLAQSSIDSIRGSSGCGQANEYGELTALLTGGPTADPAVYTGANNSFVTRCSAFVNFYRDYGLSPQQASLARQVQAPGKPAVPLRPYSHPFSGPSANATGQGSNFANPQFDLGSFDDMWVEL